MIDILRINAMVEFLGLDKEEAEQITITSWNDCVVTFKDEEYLVLKEEEAEEEFRDYQQSLIEDLGLQAFSSWGQQYIIDNFCDNETLLAYIREDFEVYVENIKHEGNRLEREMEEAEVSTEEEYIDYLCEEWEGNEVEYFISNFGEEDFSKMVIENHLIDWDEVIDWVERDGGRGCLASYDGVENEVEIEGEVMYVYRTN